MSSPRYWLMKSEPTAFSFDDLVKSKNSTFSLSQIVVPQADSWFLLSGCAATADGSGLVVRTFDRNGLSGSKLVPLRLP